MFHFGGFPSLYYLIHIMIHGSSPWWFPNSEICGSGLIYSSPQLIAVSHVLRRLPMPRHSPYALFRLNFPICKCFHLRASLANNFFRLFYFTVNFRLCAKNVVFYQLFGKTCSFLYERTKELLLLLSSQHRSLCYFFFSRR